MKDVANPAIQKREDLESALEESYGVQINEDFTPPTEEELNTLRKVSGGIPKIAYLLCIVELAERASYYGAKGVFNNYMQFPLPDGGDGTGAVPKDNPKYVAKCPVLAIANILPFQWPCWCSVSDRKLKTRSYVLIMFSTSNQGLQFASAMILLFTFLAYTVPIFGAWLADTKLGRYKTILLGVLIGGVAHVNDIILYSSPKANVSR